MKDYFYGKWKLFFYSKYFKDLSVHGEKEIDNKLFRDVVCEIGKEFAHEIPGKGSDQHKGVKKIIKHAKESLKINLTGTEIKATFRSLRNSEKCFVRCPYTTGEILKCVVQLSNNIPAVVNLCSIHISKNKLTTPSCIEIYLPDLFALIETHVTYISEFEKDRGRPIKEMKRLKELLEFMKKEFNNPCYP